jgi:hypothetical protein
MEALQKNKFPQLSHSIIQHENVKKKVKIKDNEIQMNLRGVLSQKQELIIQLEQAFLKAKSEKGFHAILEKSGLKFYSKNGEIRGVVLNRKFRFSTLGFTREILQELKPKQTKNNRMQNLERIRERQKGKSIKRGK